MTELKAAASRFINRKNMRNTKAVNASWQDEAWTHFQITPEVHFAAQWMGNAMSGVRLFAGRRNPDGSVEEAPSNSRPAELVQAIAGGPDGQAEILRAYGVHLTVVGEGWTLIIPNQEADSFADDDWRVLSTKEVQAQQGNLKVELDGAELEIPGADEEGGLDPSLPVAIRVWNAAAWRHIEADSPVRSALVLLDELQLLNAAVAAIARSRITGRGVIFVPQGTRFPAAPGEDDAADDLLALFTEVASTAIKEPDSAAATVPIILEVPPDLLGQIQHMKFESDFDDLAIKLREECIRRFATGLDVPAEILLGFANTSHWALWGLTAEAIKTGVEPNVRLVCHAYTDQWLRPLLESEQFPEADEWMVWYDTSGLRTSSNKGATALEAFKIGLISASAARRETGFTDDDAPETGVQTAPTDRKQPTPQSPAGPARELPVDQGDGMPQTLPASLAFGDLPRAGALAVAIDGILWAAMAQAGARIMRTPACPRPERGRAAREVSLAEVHTVFPVSRPEDVDAWKLLDGAWSRVPEIAERYDVDGSVLSAVLDSYARALIDARQEYNFRDVARLLKQHGPSLGLHA